MRGKVHLCSAVVCSGRIPPAYAGKRGRCLQILQEQEDHPRLCGEKSVLVMRAESPLGSPPPMRGKGFSAFEFYVDFGITPAYAGKRQRTGRHRLHRRDHPRLCGEKCEMPSTAFLYLGSPPPMRGKAGYRSRNFLTFRITPAYAGKSVPDILACVNG